LRPVAVSASSRAPTRRAIELGGLYDGHEAPSNVNSFTKASVAAVAGQGLVAAARDVYPHDGVTHSYVASFAEVEVDIETGKYHIVDFLAYADVGTVIHSKALGGQVLGRSTLGIGHAIGQKWVFDPHYGEMLSKRFYQNKPPTILDVPVDMEWAALDIPDPETPVGARGIGEPPVGGRCCAIFYVHGFLLCERRSWTSQWRYATGMPRRPAERENTDPVQSVGDHRTDELWTQLDPELWSLTHNPIASRQANSLVGSSTRTKVTADAPCTHCALPARGGSRIR